ncbi:FAD-dependent oxidoreductase [Gordonia metallireducens]|uniref:FAD-dependent oxidoreductase n=1 Tax=Gordonia metallireducens TaxID=2897779 RepID=UPI001E29B4D2|nr:FAD-dependent oxidoreductase [Gordonia metallireducens]
MTNLSPGQSAGPGHVAIIGAGPSGCYTAIALRRLIPDVEITVFDRRVTPFGLIRYGVAADHQGMKNVARQFERLFTSPGVAFVGNTTIGDDLSLEDLDSAFDAVVIATGLPYDRRMEVPLHPEARVLGAGELLRFLNADPDCVLRGSTVESFGALGESVVVVGAGNVAMDVARLVCKTDDELVGSDIDDEARAVLGTENVRHIDIVARGPRDRVRWDSAMFRELCDLPGVQVRVDGEGVHEAADEGSGDAQVVVDIHFGVETRAVNHRDGRTIVAGTRSGQPVGEVEFAADTVITAIGFVPEGGDVDVAMAGTSVFRVGGAQSGVLGNLAENRGVAKKAAAEIAAALSAGLGGKPGPAGVDHMLPDGVTDYADWCAIDHAEVGRALPGRCRTKFTSREAMLDVIRVDAPSLM